MARALASPCPVPFLTPTAWGEGPRFDFVSAPHTFRLATEPLLFVRVRKSSAFIVPGLEEVAVFFSLTPPEAGVLRALVSGHSPAEYAAAVTLSTNTARNHLASLMQKMSCSRQVELVRLGTLVLLIQPKRGSRLRLPARDKKVSGAFALLNVMHWVLTLSATVRCVCRSLQRPDRCRFMVPRTRLKTIYQRRNHGSRPVNDRYEELAMRRYMFVMLAVLLMVSEFPAASGAWATTTVINFTATPSGIAIPNITPVTNQYQSVGVLVSGATAFNQNGTLWSDPYGQNVAMAPDGLMTYTLNPSVIGNVQSLIANISAPPGVFIRAFDASGSMVGATSTSTPVANTDFSITSTGNPIATVQIQGPSDGYAVDEVSFNSSVPFASFNATVYLSPKLSAFAATENFTLAANSPALSLTTQPVTLTIGALNIGLPAGSFVKDNVPRTNSYVYRGKVNKVDLYVWVSPTSTPGNYLLFTLGGGYAFQNTLGTVPVSLTINNFSGSTNVAPHYVTLVPGGP
jgi:DNA-binding CsgD family transcriptional regulator